MHYHGKFMFLQRFCDAFRWSYRGGNTHGARARAWRRRSNFRWLHRELHQIAARLRAASNPENEINYAESLDCFHIRML
jgi:hypothetical protein